MMIFFHWYSPLLSRTLWQLVFWVGSVWVAMVEGSGTAFLLLEPLSSGHWVWQTGTLLL